MKIIKIAAKFFAVVGGLFIVSILLFISTINMIGTRADMPREITGVAIKAVKPGMTLEQVLSILGRPYKISERVLTHNISCQNPRAGFDEDIHSATNIKKTVDKIYSDSSFCCEGYKEDIPTKTVTFTYTRPIFSKCYPMLWVHFDRDSRVYSVYAKRYVRFMTFVEHEGIYDLSWGEDWKAQKIRHDTTTGYINKEAFIDCFH